jgi:hypothetical protein
MASTSGAVRPVWSVTGRLPRVGEFGR